MTTKIVRIVISQTKDSLALTGQPLEYFATVVDEETVGWNGVPRHDLENTVSAWAHTTERNREETLNRLKAQVDSTAKHKGILRVCWTHDGSVWEL